MMGMATTNPISVGDSALLCSQSGKNGRYIPWLVKLAACNAPRRSSRALMRMHRDRSLLGSKTAAKSSKNAVQDCP